MSYYKDTLVRTEIYDKLDELLLTSKYGSGMRLLIKGETGIGKKTAVNYIIENFHDLRPLVIQGYSDSLARPYGPIANAFRGFIEQSKSEKYLESYALDIAGELLKLIPLWGQYAEMIVKFYSKFKLKATKQVKEIEDILYQIKLIIEKLTKRGYLFLIFNNIENYDFSSLSLLSVLASIRNSYLQLIITCNCDTLPHRTQPEKMRIKEIEYELLFKYNFMNLELRPFSIQYTKQFLKVVLREKLRLSENNIMLLHEKSGGNPFFLKELILQLEQEGALTLKGNDYFLKENRILNKLPDSLKKLIELKLFQLQTELREVVDIAAVIGYEFNYRPIVKFLNQEPIVILRRLNDLKNIYNIIVELKQKHRFTYKAIQETIYNLLGPNLAREYHLFLAKYFEANPVESDNEYILYYHYLMAEELRTSLIHLNNSAADARHNLSYEVEADRYQKMLDLLSLIGNPDEEEIQQIRLLKAEALYNSGQFSMVLSLLNNYKSINLNRKTKASMIFQLARAMYMNEEYDAPMKMLTELLKEYSGELSDHKLVMSRLLLSAILYHIGEWEQGRKHFRKCFRIPLVLEDNRVMCSVQKRINMFYIPELSVTKLNECLETLDKKEEIYWEICHNIGCNYLFLNSLIKAKKYFLESLRFFENASNYRLAYPLNNLSIVEMIKGNLDGALVYIEKAKSCSISDFDLYSAKCNEAIVYILRNEFNMGIKLLSEILMELDDSSEVILKELAHHNLGWANMKIGHLKEAANHLLTSIPKRKHPWLDFKIAKKNRLLQQIMNRGNYFSEDRLNLESIRFLQQSGRKDSGLFLSLDYEFSEVWFWE